MGWLDLVLGSGVPSCWSEEIHWRVWVFVSPCSLLVIFRASFFAVLGSARARYSARISCHLS